jgi:6-phosphogluconolactonase
MKTAMNNHRPSNLDQDITWLEDNTAQDLALALAANIADQLRLALEQRPRASLAVSGGRTPKAMLEQLSQQKLDWSRVDVTLADERWVAEDNAASNTALVRAWLIQNEAANATFFPIYTGESTATQGQANCEQQLAKMHWPLDVLVLGMGNDGHTASLFPLCPSLKTALSTKDICIATLAPVEPTDRMTLSANTLQLAKNTYLHIEGNAKLDVLIEAATLKDNLQMPIYTFFKPSLSIHWCP